MKKIKLSAMLFYTAMLAFSACGGGGGGGSDDPQNPGGDKTISISVINGVTPPACGENPVSVITANAQFSGTVSWNTSPAKFAANTVYTATIEITAKEGYTLDGVSDDFFEVSGASAVSNDADSGIITADFPTTGSAPPVVVNINSISGVTAPVKYAIPVTTISETVQFTGNISWNGSPKKYAASTIYTATISLTAKSGYTFNGVSADSFTIAGATSVKNNADSGVITAVFPETEALLPLTESTVNNVTTITFGSGTAVKIITTPDIAVTSKFPYNIDGDINHDETTDFSNVPARFLIAETEVTYELWQEVYNWATDAGRGSKQYSFSNPGVKGDDGYDSKTEQHPVTKINWRDAMVWCNALTEYYNANNGSAADLNVVYCSDAAFTTPIRQSTNLSTISWESGTGVNDGKEDDPYVNSAAKGFRLPTGIEWEFAARYIGTTLPSHANYILKDGVYYTRANSASGDSQACNAAVPTLGNYAVYTSNSNGSTSPVKSKLPNELGIYDMSGNVYELCSDTIVYVATIYRVKRGGGYPSDKLNVIVNWQSTIMPNERSELGGIRFVRNR